MFGGTYHKNEKPKIQPLINKFGTSSEEDEKKYDVIQSATPLSREKENINYETEFKLVQPLHVNFTYFPITHELDALELNSEHKVICQIFFIIKSSGIKIIVKFHSTMIRKLSSVVFYCKGGKKLRFNDFQLKSQDPSKYWSDKIVNLSGSPSRDGPFPATILSGSINYALRQTCVENTVLKNCLQTGDYHDMKIKLDNGKEFKVHKMVLASRSQVFKNMIDSDMMESKTGIIHIKDVEPDVMQEILKFIYGLSCDVTHLPHKVFKVAHMYGLDKLTEMCRGFMMHNINHENFFGISKLVEIEEYKLKEVSYVLNDFLKNKESEIVENEEFIEYLASNMQSESIHYLFRLCMQYNLSDIKEKVIKFILSNLKKVLQNSEFKKLLNNPGWSVEIFDVLCSIQN